EGQHAEGGYPGAGLEVGQAGGEEGGVAPELVDHEPLHPPAEVDGEEGDGAVEGGEHTAPVDVAHDDGGGADGVGQPQVHQVPVEQVDLGRAAGALHDHDIEAVPQAPHGVEDSGSQPRFGGVVGGGVEVGGRLA